MRRLWGQAEARSKRVGDSRSARERVDVVLVLEILKAHLMVCVPKMFCSVRVKLSDVAALG